MQLLRESPEGTACRSHTKQQEPQKTRRSRRTKRAKSIMETQKKDRKAVVDKSSDSGCGGLTRPFWSDKRLRREHRERPLRSKFNSVEALLRPIPTKICVHPFSSASSALKVVAPRCCVSVLDFVSYLREALCPLWFQVLGLLWLICSPLQLQIDKPTFSAHRSGLACSSRSKW